MTLCRDCEHFKIRQQPIKGFDWGMAECTKYNLVVDFADKRKFKWLSCEDRPKHEALETDTVEVVRCKDCKHAYYADNRVPHERTWVCDRFMNEGINDNDFCSFGERSE